MEELIYLIVKLIAGAMADSKAKGRAAQPPVDRAWQQRVWEQQRLMQQQAALAASRKPVKPPPLLRVAAPARPAPVPAPESNWVETERASRHDTGGRGSSVFTRSVQPRSLRRRFILTEILRPPVSLRPPRM